MPEIDIAAIVSGVVEVFIRLMFFAALVLPSIWLANVTLLADKVTGTKPVPVNDAVCGEFEALSLTVRVPA